MPPKTRLATFLYHASQLVDSVPPEVFSHVAQFLEPKELSQLALTAKSIYTRDAFV